MSRYYPPALRAKVRRVYAVDYELWDALVEMDVPHATGAQLISRIARCGS